MELSLLTFFVLEIGHMGSSAAYKLSQRNLRFILSVYRTISLQQPSQVHHGRPRISTADFAKHRSVIEDMTALKSVLPAFARPISPTSVVASQSLPNRLARVPTKIGLALSRVLEDGHVISMNRFHTNICSMSFE